MVLIGVVVRVALIAFGRTTVIDGFYLQGAWLLAEGHQPYVEFPHVAFPVVEWLYAVAFAIDRSLAAASALTGAAVVATGAILTWFARRRLGVGPAWLAGALYVTAAPLAAFHAFEREVWSALFLAAACAVATRGDAGGAAAVRADRGHDRSGDRGDRGDGAAAVAGFLIALAMMAKLTAAIGAAAIGLDLLLRRSVRAAAVAAAAAAAALGAVTLFLRAAYGDVFTDQVFLFFFFKGDASTLSERAALVARHLDPNLALGLLACAAWPWLRPRGGGVAPLLLAAYLAFHAASPSLWDHNLIDLAWPAALVGATVLARLSSVRVRIALVAIALAAGVRGVAADRPGWFPHGLGGSVAHAVQAQAAFLRDDGPDDGPDDGRGEQAPVLAPTPLSCFVAGRRSIAFDFELEPVAIALTEELRRRGLAHAWSERRRVVLLGAPPGAPTPPTPARLFSARRDAAAVLHVLPRLEDAIRRREPRVVITPLPPSLMEALRAAGYEPVTRPPVHGYRAPSAAEDRTATDDDSGD